MLIKKKACIFHCSNVFGSFYLEAGGYHSKKQAYFRNLKISIFPIYFDERKLSAKVVQGIPSRLQVTTKLIGAGKLAYLSNQNKSKKGFPVPLMQGNELQFAA